MTDSLHIDIYGRVGRMEVYLYFHLALSGSCYCTTHFTPFHFLVYGE